ncbi:MAG: radical SAM protein [bacterium]
MKASRFNFLVRSPRDPNTTFLYNSFHDNRIVVEDGEVNLRELLQKVRRHEDLNDAESEAAGGLKEMGYLLEDETDEEQLFYDWFREHVTEQKEILTATILTTLACNLRCTYCYEKDKLGKSKMTPEVMEQVVQWLKHRIDTTRPAKVNLIFFGGEPLLNVDAIRKISGDISAYCRERGVAYTAGMATNGIFLTPKLVDELKEYGFEWIKITFDGDRDQHDKKRIYSGGRGTFDQIFRNLEAIAGKLQILLGGNFDQESADSFKGLLEKIAASKFREDIVATNLKPIMPEMKKHEFNGIGSSCERCAFTDTEIAKILELRREVRKVGLKPTDPINIGPCEYYRRNAVTIGIAGQLYKCIAFVGIDDGQIGDVTSQDFNGIGEEMISVKPLEHKKCTKCPFVPLCAGGCRANSYNQTGSFENISCDQNYFIKTLREELPLEYYEGAESATQMRV